MSFIIDTCVISELTKKVPDKNVLTWFENCPEDQIFISSLTLGEIQYGIEMLLEGKKKINLMVWYDELLETYKDSTLPVNNNISIRWGHERARLQKKGVHLPIIDGLIACTAVEYNYTLVTRDISEIEAIDVRFINPWES